MKKENKKLAQQKRAKERKKQAVKNIVLPIIKIGIPVLLFLVFVYMIIFNPFKLVRNGDTVNIDFVGTINGVEFEGGSAQGYELTIGSNSFIDDFEEQLIHHRVGETVTVKVTFPEDYGTEDLNGKEAVFKVKINSIVE